MLVARTMSDGNEFHFKFYAYKSCFEILVSKKLEGHVLFVHGNCLLYAII